MRTIERFIKEKINGKTLNIIGDGKKHYWISYNGKNTRYPTISYNEEFSYLYEFAKTINFNHPKELLDLFRQNSLYYKNHEIIELKNQIRNDLKKIEMIKKIISKNRSILKILKSKIKN